MFETYKAQGLEPNEAAARAVREIKRASSSSSVPSSKVTPSVSATPVDAPPTRVIERVSPRPVASSDSEDEEIQLRVGIGSHCLNRPITIQYCQYLNLKFDPLIRK